jgi:PAS domain-containing protein
VPALTSPPRPDEALLAIYDTVTDPGRWSASLDVVANVIGARGGGLYVRRLDDRPYDFAAMSAVYSQVSLDDYLARYACYEEAQWSYLNSQQPLELVLDDMAGVPRAELDVRPDYVFNREFIGIGRRLAMRLNAIPAWYDAAIFGFDALHSDIPPSSIATLRPLLPHLAKAVETGRTFAMLRAHYQAALAALDHIHVGIGIALPSGEIIVRNAEADRIFALDDGLQLGRDGHFSCPPDQRHRIERTIRRAAATLRGQRDFPEQFELVARPSGAHAFLIEVVPLSDSQGEIDRALAGALVNRQSLAVLEAAQANCGIDYSEAIAALRRKLAIAEEGMSKVY